MPTSAASRRKALWIAVIVGAALASLATLGDEARTASPTTGRGVLHGTVVAVAAAEPPTADGAFVLRTHGHQVLVLPARGAPIAPEDRGAEVAVAGTLRAPATVAEARGPETAPVTLPDLVAGFNADAVMQATAIRIAD